MTNSEWLETKRRIYETALKLFRKRLSSSFNEESPTTQEEKDCITNFNEASMMALNEYDWSFFIEELNYVKDDMCNQLARGWEHSYPLVSADNRKIFKVVPIGNKPYEVIGNRYYTNEMRPSIWVIMEDCIMEKPYPKNFEYLVAYALAYQIAPLLAPQDQTLLQSALQRYSIYAKALREAEVYDNSKEKTILEDLCGDDTVRFDIYEEARRAAIRRSNEVNNG